jgi:hypothetical protein
MRHRATFLVGHHKPLSRNPPLRLAQAGDLPRIRLESRATRIQTALSQLSPHRGYVLRQMRRY